MVQKEVILKYLQKHKSITSLQAFKKFNITRLSAVIYQLRDEGYDIETERKINKNTGTSFGYYTLIK